MASRIIHLAIAYGISKRREIHALPRFFLGSVLPDASDDKSAHFPIIVCGGERKTFDLTSFRRDYSGLISSDSLYLGYYLHLVEDIIFRDLMYGAVGFDPRIPGAVEALHRDYGITNGYVVDRYGLSDDLLLPDGIESEPIVVRFGLDAASLLDEIHGDFCRSSLGSTSIFTEEMADGIISRTTDACVREIDALSGKVAHFDEIALAWERHPVN